MRISLMIEGQNAVAWEHWRGLAAGCEEHGLHALYRSDHYLSVGGFGEGEVGGLDAWTTLAGLAAITKRIRLGTLVSPVTFRHPSVIAKSVTTVDHISGGRADLGLGAGWHEREHAAYGFAFPPIGERMTILAEQLAIVRGSWGDGPYSHEGQHYRLDAVDAQPKPVQRPGPRLLMGGDAKPRGAALAARYADEYNLVYPDPEAVRVRRARLERACRDAGRDPATLPLSVMLPTIIGRDRAEVEERVRVLAGRAGHRDGAALREAWGESALIGTADEVGERLRAYAAVGVTGVMLQYLLHDDPGAVAAMGDLAAAF